jgi:hypothetical protein
MGQSNLFLDLFSFSALSLEMFRKKRGCPKVFAFYKPGLRLEHGYGLGLS